VGLRRPLRRDVALRLGSAEVLAEAGWGAVHERGVELAAHLAAMLEEAGHTVRPRGDSTLVTWESDDAPAANERAHDAGVLIRDIPGRAMLRASVGAWNDETDLERLLAVL